MPDVSKLRLDNVTYDIKDDNARKYLVMVNEEPVSATKIVVETGGDAIELVTADDHPTYDKRFCTSASRPTMGLHNGMMYKETDTHKLIWYYGDHWYDAMGTQLA